MEWNFPVVPINFSVTLGQPHEAYPKFLTFIPENFCAIWFLARNFWNFWLNVKRPVSYPVFSMWLVDLWPRVAWVSWLVDYLWLSHSMVVNVTTSSHAFWQKIKYLFKSMNMLDSVSYLFSLCLLSTPSDILVKLCPCYHPQGIFEQHSFQSFYLRNKTSLHGGVWMFSRTAHNKTVTQKVGTSVAKSTGQFTSQKPSTNNDHWLGFLDGFIKLFKINNLRGKYISLFLLLLFLFKVQGDKKTVLYYLRCHRKKTTYICNELFQNRFLMSNICMYL